MEIISTKSLKINITSKVMAYSSNQESSELIRDADRAFPLDLSKLVFEPDQSAPCHDHILLKLGRGEETGKFHLYYSMPGLNIFNRFNKKGYDTKSQALEIQKRLATAIDAGNYQLIFRGMRQGFELKADI